MKPMIPRRWSLLGAGLLALLALTTSCAPAAARARNEPRPLGRFSASSLNSVYGIQGLLSGSVARRGDWLAVIIDSGAVRTQQADPGRIWNLRLRAGLARCRTAGGSEVVSESRAVRLAPLVGVTDQDAILDATLRPLRDTVRFEVAIPPGTQLDRSWVVLTLEWPFENEFAAYDLETGVALDGRRVAVSGVPTTGGRVASMSSRCIG
jgi:hypothetical protein